MWVIVWCLLVWPVENLRQFYSLKLTLAEGFRYICCATILSVVSSVIWAMAAYGFLSIFLFTYTPGLGTKIPKDFATSYLGILLTWISWLCNGEVTSWPNTINLLASYWDILWEDGLVPVPHMKTKPRRAEGRFGQMGTLIHCCWECEFVQTL